MKKYSTVIDINSHINNLSYSIQPVNDGIDIALSFDNKDYGIITAIKFIAKGFNSFGEPVLINHEKQFSILFQDLRIENNQRVEKLHYKLLNHEIRKIELEESRICYDDGRIESYKGIKEFEISTEEYEDCDAETLSALRDVICDKIKYVPKEYECGWFCGCGYFNRKNSVTCAACKTDKEKMLNISNKSSVNAAIEKHNQLVAERAELQKEQDQKKKKKNRRIILLLCAVVVLALGITALWFFQATRSDISFKDDAKTETVYQLYNGKKLKEIVYNIDGDKKKERLFDSDEKLTKETEFDSDGEIDSESEYNSDEKLTKKTKFDSDGKIYNVDKYEYDENGNMTKENHLDHLGLTTEAHEYEYDSDGNKIKDTKYGGSGENIYVDEYNGKTKAMVKHSEYDSDKKLLSEIEYNSSGEESKTTYYGSPLDDNIERVEITPCENNRFLRTEYYKDGTKIEEYYTRTTEWFGETLGELLSATEYDAKGNRIKTTYY